MEYENDLDIFNSLDEESTLQKSSEENVDGKKDTSQEEVNTEENTSPVIDEQSLLESVLKSRGIDFNNIKVEDTETGVIHSVPFTELSREEQIELLNLEEDDYNLDDDEINLLTFMRENNLNSESLVNYYKQKGIEEYLANEGAVYKVDELSDEDIYALYIKNNYGDILTEDELVDEVNKAKENSESFEKKVNKLREIYKAEEERLSAEAKQKEEQDSQLSEEELNKIIGTLREAGKNIKTIGGFDLEESDIDSTMDYITKPQITGRTKLASDLDNPDTLFKLAFYATHGDELIEAIHEHYNNVLNDEEYLKNRLEKLNKLKNKKRSNNTSNLSTGKDNKIENSDLKSFLNLKD